MKLLFSAVVAYFAAKLFGPELNKWLWGPYNHQSDIGGYALVFIAGILGAGLFLWPIALSLWHDNVGSPFARARQRTKDKGWTTYSRQQIEQGVQLIYIGLVDRDLPYLEGGWNRKGRVRTTFQLDRHTMAMQPRERVALNLLNRLIEAGEVTGEFADQAQFALTWGDGRAAVSDAKITADRALVQQNGIKTIRDLVALEANYRNAFVDVVISELFGRLQAAASRKESPKDLVALLQQLTPTMP